MKTGMRIKPTPLVRAANISKKTTPVNPAPRERSEYKIAFLVFPKYRYAREGKPVIKKQNIVIIITVFGSFFEPDFESVSKSESKFNLKSSFAKHSPFY